MFDNREFLVQLRGKLASVASRRGSRRSDNGAVVGRQAGTSLQNLRSGLGTGVFRTTLSLPISLLMIPFVLTQVSLTDYGIWVTLSSVLALGALADAGIRTEVSRRIAIAQGAGDSRTQVQVLGQGLTLLTLLGGMMALGGILAASTISALLFPDLSEDRLSDLSVILRLLFMLLAVQLVAGGFFATLSALQRRDWENLGHLTGLLIGTAVTILMMVRSPGIEALLMGTIVTTCFTVLVQYIGVRRTAPLLPFKLRRISRGEARALLGLSTYLTIVQLANTIDFQFDKIVLSRVIAPDAAAEYQLGVGLTTSMRSFVLLPAGLLLAGLAELGMRSPQRERRLYDSVAGLTFALAALGFGGLIVVGPLFVHLWLGEGYARTGQATVLLAVALAISTMTAPLYFFAISQSWHRHVAAAATANLILNLASSLGFTLLFGFLGALCGSILGNLIGAGILIFLMSQRAADRICWKLAIASILAAIPGTIGVLLWLTVAEASWVTLLISSCAYCLSTLVFLIGFKVVRVRDVQMLLRRKQRSPEVGRLGSAD